MGTGFGNGAFGAGGFGEWLWSHAQFIETLPAIYRDQDAEADGRLVELLESIIPSFDHLRLKIRDIGELRDPLVSPTDRTFQQSILILKSENLDDGTARVFFSVGVNGDKFLGVRPGQTVTDGIGNRFVIVEVNSSALPSEVPNPPTDPATSAPSGKHIIVSSIALGNQITIPFVSSTYHEEENPTPSPLDNGTLAGPYTFTVANIPVARNRILVTWTVGAEERFGYFSNTGARSGDLKVGSSVNFTTGVIKVATGEVVDSDSIRVTYSDTTVPTDDPSKISSQHILSFLAKDYGIDLDRSDPEPLQRSLAYHAWQLWGIKGSKESYEVLGKMAGYLVSVLGLYRIDSSWVPSLPAERVYEIPAASGKYYTDVDPLGALFDEIAADAIPLDLLCHSDDYPSRVQDIDVIDVVELTEEGTNFRYLVTVETTDMHESYMTHGTFTDSGADEYDPERFTRIDSTSYSFEVIAAAPPPLGVGTMEWSVAKLDGVTDSDIAIAGLGTDIEEIGTQYEGYTGIRYRLTHTFSGAQSIASAGNWAIVDANGIVSWIEDVHIDGLTYKFEFVATSPPPNGSPANIFYVCTAIPSCSFCRASSIRVAINQGSILDFPPEDQALALAEDAVGRLITRLRELLPAHIDFADFSLGVGV